MDNHNDHNNTRSNDHSNDRNSRDNQNEGHPLLSQALRSVLGGFFASQRSNGPAHDQGSGISLNAHSAPPSDSFIPPSNQDDFQMAGLLSNFLHISDIYHQPQESEDLPVSHPQVPSTSSDAGPTQSDSAPSTASHPATQHRVSSHTNLPDVGLYDMPALEDSSDSDEEVEVDVEMADADDPPLPDLPSNPPHLPGNITGTLPSSSATTPPISSPPSPPGSVPPTHPPSRLARRARVEEDEDADDFRETNRQRRHSPSFIDGDHLHAPIPPVNPTQPIPSQNRPPPHAHRRIVLGGDSGFGRVVFDIVVGPGVPPPTQGGQQPTQGPQHHVHDENNDNGFNPGNLGPNDGFMLFDFPLGEVGDLENPFPGAQEETDGQIPPTTDGEVPPTGFVEMLLGMFGGAGMGGFGFGEEEDDPERAKKLLDGLDVVDEGLVKRLERIGFGGDGKDGSAEPGPVNCAVCWEGLLEEVPDEEHTLSSDSSETASRPLSEIDTASTLPPPLEAVASSSELPPSKTHKRKIVTLPCSHVFHAECLLPWFTRPHRTTCPTCRFDIDPESLTYVPRPRRLRTANPAAGVAEGPRPQGTAAHEGLGGQPFVMFGPPLPTAATATTATAPPIGIPQPGLVNANAVPNLPNTNVPGHAQPNAPGVDIPFYLALDISMFMPIRPPGGTPTPAVGSQTQPPGAQTQPQTTPTAPRTPSQRPVGPVPPPVSVSGAQVSPPLGTQDPLRTVHQLFGMGGLPNGMGVINIPLGLGTGRGRSQTGVNPSRQAGTNSATPNPVTTAQPDPGPQPTTILNPPPTTTDATPNTNEPNPSPLGQGFGGFLSHVLQQVVQAAARSGFNLGNPGAQPQGGAQPQQAGPQPQNGATIPPSDQPTPAHEPRRQAQPLQDGPFLDFFDFYGAGIGGTGGLNPTPGANPTNQNRQAFPLGAGVFGAPTPNPFRRSATGMRVPNAPKPQWTLPPPPGLTLHERVEKRERELGLRCSDMSCGLGPTDEDPIPVSDVGSISQVGIRPLKEKGTDSGKGKERKVEAVGLPENEPVERQEEFVCGHKFHPACLVVAERVAGWGGEDIVKEEKTGDEEVEVSCPVCRAVGCITRDEWDDGACSLA